ncbi:MAG: DivIVA domain-containing protein [Aquiluna sp.]|nr:DivIVA domain-containing protein [Aquiluna sp.]
MAMSPEDILSKRFLTTKFREGYDQDEVDDFLDEVVLEFRRVLSENQDLKSDGSSPLEALSNPSRAADFPVASDVVDTGALEGTDSSKSIIELAQKLHEDHVRDGQVKRDQLVRDGQEQAARLIRDAEAESREINGKLELEKKQILEKIEELKLFESEYREKLRHYIEDQLATLEIEGVSAPAIDNDVSAEIPTVSSSGEPLTDFDLPETDPEGAKN